MWFLTGCSDATKDLKIWLRPGKTYTVGRKNCDITLGADKAVSRLHATIIVGRAVAEGDFAARYTITVKDAGAKFGSFVNNTTKVTNSVALKENDVVKFGVNSSEFKLISEAVVICCSGLRASQRSQISAMAKKYDMRTMKDWTSDCTHLVMSAIKVTMKVVLALASCKPIVTDGWVKAFDAVGDTNFALPDVNNYLPPVVEESFKIDQEMFRPNEERRTMLGGKTIVTFTEMDFKSLQTAVTTAGGNIVDRSKELPTDNETSLRTFIESQPDPCMIKPDAPGFKYGDLIRKAAASASLRLLNSDAIAIAILNIATHPHLDSSIAGASLSLDASRRMAPSLQTAQGPDSLGMSMPYSIKSQAPVQVHSRAADTHTHLMARGASSNTISRPETQAPQSARPKAAAFDDFLDDLMGGPPPTTSRTAASKQIRGNGQAASAQKEPLSLAEQLGLVGGPDVEAESGGRSTRSPPPQTAASSSTDSTPKRKLPFSEPEALPASKKLKPTLAESRPRQEARDLTSTSEDGEGRSQKGGTASRAATPFRHTSALDESFVVPPSALPDLRRTQQPAESVATSRDKGKGRVDVVPVDIMDVDEQPQQGGTSRWTRTSPTSAAQSKVTAPASIPKRKTPFETPKVENEPRQRRRLNGTNGMDEGRGQKGPALITDPEELAGLRDLVQVEYFDVVAASVGASASVGGEVSISEPNFKRFRKNQPPSAVPTRIVPIAVYNADDIPVVGRNGGGWALKPNARKPADRKKSQRVELEADPDEEVEEDVEEDSENQDRVKSSARSQYSSRSQVASSSRESTPARNVGIGRSSFGGRAFVVRDEDDEEEGGWGQMLGK